MLLAGKIPYASTFAVFAAGRAYDQIRNSICYPNLNVKICSTHAGITVGEDGATHQMLEDISMMRTLPNMTVMSVSDDTQTKWAVEEISKIKGPVYLRLSRMETPIIYSETQKFEIGKAVQIGEGTEASIIATGDVVCEAIKAKEELEKQGIKEQNKGKEPEWKYGNNSVTTYTSVIPNKTQKVSNFGFRTAESFLNNLGKKITNSKEVDLSQYEAGVRVFHKKFGEGTINYVEQEGDDLKVDITFDKVGHKRLMAKFAGLEIID